MQVSTYFFSAPYLSDSALWNAIDNAGGSSENINEDLITNSVLWGNLALGSVLSLLGTVCFSLNLHWLYKLVFFVPNK